MVDGIGARRSPISDKYLGIYETYYARAAKQRFVEIGLSVKMFKQSILSRHFDFTSFYDCYVDDVRLKHAVYSYFMDIIRHKEFHFNGTGTGDEPVSVHGDRSDGGKYIDTNKQAAYMVKWLLKTKPISIMICPETNKAWLEVIELAARQKDLIIYTNEMFALIYATGVLGVNPMKIDNSYKERLIYQLHYRPFEEGACIEMFDLLKKLYSF